MSNRNYNTQTNPNRQKSMNGGRAKKNMGGSMNPSIARQDMASGYYPSDMGMSGGAMYKKGGRVKKKKQGYKDRKDESIAMRIKKKRTKKQLKACLLYTSPSPRDRTRSRMPSSA